MGALAMTDAKVESIDELISASRKLLNRAEAMAERARTAKGEERREFEAAAHDLAAQAGQLAKIAKKQAAG